MKESLLNPVCNLSPVYIDAKNVRVTGNFFSDNDRINGRKYKADQRDFPELLRPTEIPVGIHGYLTGEGDDSFCSYKW
jgi:hypothetical protein